MRESGGRDEGSQVEGMVDLHMLAPTQARACTHTHVASQA